MSLFLRIDINIVAMILLSSILFIAVKNLEKRDKLNRTFLIISTIILFELFFETMTCVINGQHGQWQIPVSVFMHVSLFAISPILTYFWYTFIKNWLDADTTSLQEILSADSGFYQFRYHCFYRRVRLYFFNQQRKYIPKRAVVLADVRHHIFLYGLQHDIDIIHRKKLLKEEFLPLIVISIIPIAGGVFKPYFTARCLFGAVRHFVL